MWVRFWYKGNCASGLNAEESVYQWQASDSSDECFEDYAQELVPACMRDSERGCYSGFERIDKPPPEELAKLLNQYTRTLVHASEMILLLVKETTRQTTPP